MLRVTARSEEQMALLGMLGEQEELQVSSESILVNPPSFFGHPSLFSSPFWRWII